MNIEDMDMQLNGVVLPRMSAQIVKLFVEKGYIAYPDFDARAESIGLLMVRMLFSAMLKVQSEKEAIHAMKSEFYLGIVIDPQEVATACPFEQIIPKSQNEVDMLFEMFSLKYCERVVNAMYTTFFLAQSIHGSNVTFEETTEWVWQYSRTESVLPQNLMQVTMNFQQWLQ